MGTDLESREQVAVKVEPSVAKHPQLMYEAKIYKSLAGTTGFPRLRHCYLEARRNVLVVDLLGPSLEDLLCLCGNRFSLKTVLMLADQLLERLESLHSMGYVHRDIKPENALIGRDDAAGTVHLIDFGLSKRFRDPVSQQHIPFREGKSLKGTPRYASVNALKGTEQSRRDDLEALGYVLVYFLRGSLPWQGCRALTKRVQYEKLAQSKLSATAQELCEGLPGQGELAEYFAYCRGMGFAECPDYGYLRRLFSDLFAREGYAYDLVFDWTRPGDQLREGALSPPAAA